MIPLQAPVQENVWLVHENLLILKALAKNNF